MIYCIGRNYVEHIAELGHSKPDEIVIFIKPDNAILQGNKMPIPLFTNDLQYECELIFRISNKIDFINSDNIFDKIDAVSVGIDFTARDIQNKMKQAGLPWEKAKAFKNSAIVGEWIQLSNEIKNKTFEFSLQKNGQIVQQGNSKMMIHNISRILQELSIFFTLQQGDIIFTGTPKGVGSTKPNDLFKGYLADKLLFQIEII